VEKKLEAIENKVDKLDERLDSIEKVLIKQELNIDIHIKRTNLLEESVSLLREDLRPLERHVDYIHGALKMIGGIAVLIGMLVGATELISFLSV